MRALVVSLGSIGRRHLQNLRRIRPDWEIGVLRRRSEQKVEGADRVFERMSAALDFAPDLAILANPAPWHVETGLELAERDVHLLVEKPLSDSLKGVDELIESCDERGLVFMVGYCMRFHPGVRRMHEELGAAKIGQPLYLRAEVGQHLLDWRPGRDYRQSVSARADLGGGVVLELSHELDLARWLVGEVRSVTAQTARLSGLEIDVEDTADILLEFEGGALGSVHLDMARPIPARRTEIVGEKGALRLDLLAHRLSWIPPQGPEHELWSDPVPERNSLYLAELAHFLECVENGRAPEISGADGRAALALAVAVKRSAELRRSVGP